MEMHLVQDIKNVAYGSSEYHQLIIKQANKNFSTGENGAELTIMVLSMNRSCLTIQLMQSINKQIPNFAGKLLIVDNGSESQEKDAVTKAMGEMPYDCRMLELNKNYGVSGGRNRGIEQVETPWVMSIDNDIYFIGNPLPQIDHDLQVLGCHFLNIPLLDETGKILFANGGHLYLYPLEDGVHIGAGSMYQQQSAFANTEYSHSLGTFIFGGASVFRKETFLHCGGFDEGMFIGFEDIDFSLTVFREGYKVGNCGIACLVHDHPKPQNDSDIEYEKDRFSREILKKSADYFKKKNNLIVWNSNVDQWLEQKRSELGIGEALDWSKDPRPKIALVVDAKGWAFDNISRQLEKNLGGYYHFVKIYMPEYDNIAQVIFATKDCAVTHFFWRPHVDAMYSDICRSYIENIVGGSYEEFRKTYIDNKIISTSVYDHLLLDDQYLEMTVRSLDRANHYYVSSPKIDELYTHHNRFRNPDMVLPDGVDLQLFTCKEPERFKADNLNRTIRIGWVGNSKWEVGDLKGINTIIKPAIEMLVDSGYDLELIMSDRQKGLIPHDEMPEFYANIDLYICASIHEGTPNPVLEAMACGVPVISTDVGIVRNAFGPKQRKWILRDREPHQLAEMIRRLLEQREEFYSLSLENREQILKWDWSLMARQFRQYFELCLR